MNRALETTIAIVSLPAILPVILLCSILVKLTSKGPAIFRQARVGVNEKPFTCYKLRTMYIDTADRPSHETAASSITPLGGILRRLKLDELPQIWNIIRGEMSFVGPRPCLPSQVGVIEARRAYNLYSIRPGITGVAQIAGVDMADPVRLATLDAEYLKDRSIFRDISLILKTVTGAGRGDAVVAGQALAPISAKPKQQEK